MAGHNPAVQDTLTSALPAPGNDAARSQRALPIIVQHEIVNLPSASVLAALRQKGEGHTQSRKEVAVLADPVFDGDDARVRTSGRHTELAETRGEGRLDPDLTP